ncbi:MAG: branched-chain amino acid ABC transporter permease [Actinomycetota bacterium]
MTRFVQALVIGLGLASIYALLALGFVIIYKSMGVVSFAQPGLMILGAYWVIYLATVVDLSFWFALPLAMILTAVTGLVIERLAIRPMVGKPVFAIAMITIGIDIVLRVFVSDALGSDVRSVGDPWGLRTIEVAGVSIQHRRIAMVLFALVTVAILYLFFNRTRIGLAMRATAFDQEAALAQGVSVGAVFALSWAIAGALAALAGMFVGTGSGIDQGSAFVALKALPAVILGGLDSITGAIAGALIIGIFEGLTVTYQGEYLSFLGGNFSQVVPYLVMLVVLLIRPYGLFGTPEIERV